MLGSQSNLSGEIYYTKINYYFGGENMPVEVANTISSVGIFFTGLGILLLSFGLFWFVDVYKKSKK